MTAITRDQPEMILFLGDSFHRAHLAETLADAYREQIDACCGGREVVWLSAITIRHCRHSFPAGGGGMAQPDTTFRHIAEKLKAAARFQGIIIPKHGSRQRPAG